VDVVVDNADDAGHPARPGRRRRGHARAVPAHRAARLDLRTAIGLE
jgi:hypothetical protein